MEKKKTGKKKKSTVQLRLFQSVLQFLFSSYLHTDNSSKVKKGFVPLCTLSQTHFKIWAYNLRWKINNNNTSSYNKHHFNKNKNLGMFIPVLFQLLSMSRSLCPTHALSILQRKKGNIANITNNLLPQWPSIFFSRKLKQQISSPDKSFRRAYL